MTIANIKVNIMGIKTDDRYFSFNYKCWINDELKLDDKHESDHSWLNDHKKFAKVLADGYAVQIVLEKIKL